MAISHGSLPFQEQIGYFRQKLSLPTRSWTDIYTSEHDQAFVVAGAAKRDLLADMRSAVERAIAEGGTLEQFRQDFDKIVDRHGWQYNGSRGWRTRVIWETNLRQSYNAGREAQMADPELRRHRPYGLYRHGDSRNPRPQHLAWDGTVLPLDDPWWATHTPQNGWGCSCKKFMIGPRDVERMGLTVADRSPPVDYEEHTIGQRSPNGPRTVRVPRGIDPGFEHAPGRSRLDAAVPKPRAFDPLSEPRDAGPRRIAEGLPNRGPIEELPPPRQLPASYRLQEGLADEQYVDRFLSAFGATDTQPTIFRDVSGEAVAIGRDLFVDRKTGNLKVTKRGRERLLPVLAEALKAPDEIWVRMEWLYALKRAVVRRRYIARFEIEGSPVPALAVFEVGDDGWAGVTTFAADSQDYLEALRLGVRLYRRAQ